MPKIAKDSARVAGFRDMVLKGSVHADDDPVVKAAPWLFADPADHAEATKPRRSTADLGETSMSSRKRDDPVEAATAAPNEKRNTRRGKRS